MTDTEIKTLLDDARCVNSCVPAGIQLAVLIALIWDGIESGSFSGGGGSGGASNGSGPPTTAPSGTAGTYWDYTNKTLYMWNPVTLSWEQ